MSKPCLQCGAVLLEESTCQTIHEELLSFEALNAVAHSIHFLHVTCFLIQHERYSDEALVWAQSMLQVHLDANLTEQQLLRSLRSDRKQQASHPRTWKFNRSADARPLPKIAWPLTIVDVAQYLHNAQMYSERVKQWAQAVVFGPTPSKRLSHAALSSRGNSHKKSRLRLPLSCVIWRSTA
ncbi:hypothetical protein Krac_10831 [Ktedonobacter racemifer DSM 44963]|uniref:Uncharacterized protein n=1 Tax=Ktedonobacter racemifer DSM 44963 TaxID=485913 RepID=D6TIM7_KTERA|nr:hypothetical protein Krac_10831 [Ktedonobacter racemifer DSM 44963]